MDTTGSASLPQTLKVASLNLCWQATDDERVGQRSALADGDFDVVMLQEARKVDLAAISEDFDWCVHSLGEDIHDHVLGCAVLGRNGTESVGVHQLAKHEFVNDDVYEDLARWFHERHVATDVRLQGGATLRVMSAHATPGTSKGPGSPKRGVGRRKPWFHTRIARWIAEWDKPYIFAIDANSPRDDVLDWDDVQFHIPSTGPGSPGEDLLLGRPGTNLHGSRDLWHVWLDSEDGRTDREAIPDGGPLARSHFTGGRWFRYDHLYGTPDITPTAMSYTTFDPRISDHALVSATLKVGAAS